jgi:hypothetical protein
VRDARGLLLDDVLKEGFVIILDSQACLGIYDEGDPQNATVINLPGNLVEDGFCMRWESNAWA